LHTLSQAECVVALTAYQTPQMREYADVILPVAAFTEMAGTFVNCEGQWQSFQACVSPRGESRPGWKVLRVLANMLALPDFQYQALDEVSQECMKEIKQAPTLVPRAYTAVVPEKTQSHSELTRIADTPLYAVDPMTRRSLPLQETRDTRDAHGARMNAQTATAHQLMNAQVRVVQEGQEIILPVTIDERIPQHSVYIAQGLTPSIGLGEVYAPIILEKA
jgi:NADH-quinone oxidoreductase subunit G